MEWHVHFRAVRVNDINRAIPSVLDPRTIVVDQQRSLVEDQPNEVGVSVVRGGDDLGQAVPVYVHAGQVQHPPADRVPGNQFPCSSQNIHTAISSAGQHLGQSIAVHIGGRHAVDHIAGIDSPHHPIGAVRLAAQDIDVLVGRADHHFELAVTIQVGCSHRVERADLMLPQQPSILPPEGVDLSIKGSGHHLGGVIRVQVGHKNGYDPVPQVIGSPAFFISVTHASQGIYVIIKGASHHLWPAVAV